MSAQTRRTPFVASQACCNKIPSVSLFAPFTETGEHVAESRPAEPSKHGAEPPRRHDGDAEYPANESDGPDGPDAPNLANVPHAALPPPSACRRG